MSGPTGKYFRGPWGEATELTVPHDGNPDHLATLANWFVWAPPAHPLWPHYILSCVHLRDIEGQSKPPHRRFSDASHEVLLIALNPQLGPWTAENVVEKLLARPERSPYLRPLNACEQFSHATDDQAIELTRSLAWGLVTGHLPIEPDDVRGGRDRWPAVINATLEHIRLGTHPAFN
jgi:hypothetical protein